MLRYSSLCTRDTAPRLLLQDASHVTTKGFVISLLLRHCVNVQVSFNFPIEFCSLILVLVALYDCFEVVKSKIDYSGV
ncbi:hypothetical protein VNO78_27286 [Psophocarpus tetragonolobus]|uniref:Uncharacterized protein n=1 Tax=Psophocarpus tetragonolobus TaxID=3891 RepID=A0AAN9S0G0_PSOTE